MRKYIIILLVFASCSDFEKSKLDKRNPTEYTYTFSTEKVKTVILDQFSNKKYRKMTLYYLNGNLYPDSVKIFNQTNNENDFCLSTYGDPIGKSFLYSKNDIPLDYVASFHLHLSKIDSSQTKVNVITLKSKVILGLELLPNIHGVRTFDYKNVEPTTIEEYEILLKIGKTLGQSGMPELELPEK